MSGSSPDVAASNVVAETPAPVTEARSPDRHERKSACAAAGEAARSEAASRPAAGTIRFMPQA